MNDESLFDNFTVFGKQYVGFCTFRVYEGYKISFYSVFVFLIGCALNDVFTEIFCQCILYSFG